MPRQPLIHQMLRAVQLDLTCGRCLAESEIPWLFTQLWSLGQNEKVCNGLWTQPKSSPPWLLDRQSAELSWTALHLLTCESHCPRCKVYSLENSHVHQFQSGKRYSSFCRNHRGLPHLAQKTGLLSLLCVHHQQENHLRYSPGSACCRW